MGIFGSSGFKTNWGKWTFGGWGSKIGCNDCSPEDLNGVFGHFDAVLGLGAGISATPDGKTTLGYAHAGLGFSIAATYTPPSLTTSTAPIPTPRPILAPYTPEQKAQLDALPDDICFLAGTMVDMWPFDLKPDVTRTYDEKNVLAKVWQKPIEEVTPEDWVLSYDDNGRLKPGRVTRTFQNHSKHILDVHGLMMTPGHVTYCAPVEGEENKFAGKHVPVMDILRSDGALMKADGTLIRAATDCEVGSEDDKQFWAFLLYEDKDGTERVRDKCQLRLGTRWMLPDGSHFSMHEYMKSGDIELIEKGPQRGYMRFKRTGLVTVFAWTFSDTLPKAEDYVLQRSQVTLEEIYEADEWEAVGPQIPAPFMGEAGRSYKRDNTPNTGLYADAASSDHLPPNIPHSMRNSPNQPTMSRKQRRAVEAKQRKVKKQATAIVH